MIPEFRIVTGTDPDLFQERLNRYLQNLDPGTEIVYLLFSTSQIGGETNYSVLIGVRRR